MKFDDLLAQYLYENKSLQLQGIGTFQLDRAINLPQEHEKEIYYPIEGLAFTYSPKDLTNEDLIAFLVKKLGKIQPLVRSDLESYLSNIKQFINIGKPYTIEGIGTLQKNNQGIYEFTPGNFLPVKEELSPHKDNPEHQHRQRALKSESGRNTTIFFIILVVALVIAGAIWGVSALMKSNNMVETTAARGDTTENSSTSRPPDTLATVAAPVVNNLVSDTGLLPYKLIFDITRSSQRIQQRSDRLRRDGVFFKVDTLTQSDSTVYRMYIPKKLRNTDTTRVKDSLYKFFIKRIIVERDQ